MAVMLIGVFCTVALRFSAVMTTSAKLSSPAVWALLTAGIPTPQTNGMQMLAAGMPRRRAWCLKLLAFLRIIFSTS
jgi:hypothetical protein